MPDFRHFPSKNPTHMPPDFFISSLINSFSLCGLYFAGSHAPVSLGRKHPGGAFHKGYFEIKYANGITVRRIYPLVEHRIPPKRPAGNLFVGAWANHSFRKVSLADLIHLSPWAENNYVSPSCALKRSQSCFGCSKSSQGAKSTDFPALVKIEILRMY